MDLLEVKKALEKKKTELNMLKGQQEMLLKDLKKSYNISTIEEAEIYLRKLKKEATAQEQELQEKMQEFEDEFGDLL